MNTILVLINRTISTKIISCSSEEQILEAAEELKLLSEPFDREIERRLASLTGMHPTSKTLLLTSPLFAINFSLCNCGLSYSYSRGERRLASDRRAREQQRARLLGARRRPHSVARLPTRHAALISEHLAN